MFYSFVNEIKKILLSMLFSFIIMLIFEMLSKIPEETEDALNEELTTKDKIKILEAK